MTEKAPPTSGKGSGASPPPAPPPSSSEALDPRWPFPQGPTAPDEAAQKQVLNLAEAFIAESSRVRTLQVSALGLAAGVAFALLILLFCVVRTGFEDHLGKAEEMLIKVSERPWVAANAPSAVDSSAVENRVRSSGVAPPSTAASSAELAASERKSLHELLATGLKSLAYSTVAVISILVVAICIITLGMAKVVFAMTPHRLSDESKSFAENERGQKSDPGIVLPNLEFAKEFTKLFTDLIKRQKG